MNERLIDTAEIRQGEIEERLAKGEGLPFYFKVRMARKGPFVAAKVSRQCACTINGGDDCLPHEWQESCDRYPDICSVVNGEEYPLRRLLTGGQLTVIEQKEYRYLIDAAAWDKKNDPDSPLANPTQAVDYGRMKPIF